MKPAVVLIQPLTNIFDRGKKLPTLPLSLLSAASRLQDNYELRLVDLRADSQWRKSLAALLADSPICAATTSITGNQIFSALEVSRFVKSLSPVPVVWGGMHGSLFPDQVLAERSVDYVVRKEGESTFAELVDCLDRRADPANIRGLSYRAGQEIRHNPDREFIDLETAREIPYHILDRSPFFITQGSPTLYIETARGCFSRCAYCYNASYHKSRWRGQSSEKVLARIELIRGRFPEIRHLSIVDDNYFGDPDRARRIAEGLVRLGSPITYQVQGAHIQVVSKMSEDELELLRRSGCSRLDMGLESGSSRVLAAMHKNIDLNGILDLNRRLDHAGITPWYNFIVGFPDETDEEIDSTRRFLLRLLDDNPRALVSPVYQLVPYPGTEIFEQAVSRGFRPPQSIEDWKDYHSGGIDIPWQSPQRRRHMGKLYFLSIFADSKLDVYDTSPLYRLLARIYRPVARWRLRRNCLALMPEYRLFRLLFNIS